MSVKANAGSLQSVATPRVQCRRVRRRQIRYGVRSATCRDAPVSVPQIPTELAAFNPMSPEFIKNPYPVYEVLRDKAPVIKTPLGFWLVSRHEHVNLLVRDRRFGKGFEKRMTRQYGAEYLNQPAIRSL